MRKHFSAATAALLVTATFSSSVLAISKVTRGGRYLYNDDGSRFYIKGIAYQEQGTAGDNAFLEPTDFTDPLIDGAACTRDVKHLTDLNVNTIRVYSVDHTKNHDSCMKTFSDAGIYTIIDLSLPVNGSLDRKAPAWTTNLLSLYTNTIDAFSAYDNVLAYNVGNEVVIAENGTAAGAYIKAAARDIKAYLKSKKSTALVGYAAIDGTPTWRDPLANYLSCDVSNGNSDATAIDLYGLNNYEWCGDSTFQASYAGTNGDYAGLNIPAYFSEYGCVVSGQTRTWQEVTAIYSSQMSDIWSGGLAFSYFPATSAAGQFGIVTISSDGKTVTTSTDYDNLKAQYGKVTPPNTPTKASAGSTTYPSCPTTNSTFLAGTKLPPTPNEKACECLQSQLSCKFTPQTNNYNTIVGQLLDTACSLLGGKGGNCNDIAGDGATGTYGRVSGCDPTVKLSYIMSQFYEANNRQGQACSFAGNGTVNPLAPTSAAAANAAASSCVANPDATFVPSAAPNSGGSSSSGSGTKGSSSSSPHNGAVNVFGDGKSLVGLGLMVVVGVVSAVFTVV
jgi:hypothetical protein